MMATSYEGASAPTSDAHFRDGWFYPGDVGRLYEDGLLAIDGRTGDTLNVGGWKVGAVDLEARVAELPHVRDVCAVAMGLKKPLKAGDKFRMTLMFAKARPERVTVTVKDAAQ